MTKPNAVSQLNFHYATPQLDLEFELVLTHITQMPVLRVERYIGRLNDALYAEKLKVLYLLIFFFNDTDASAANTYCSNRVDGSADLVWLVLPKPAALIPVNGRR